MDNFQQTDSYTEIKINHQVKSSAWVLWGLLKKTLTCKPPLPPEWSIIDSLVGLFHLLGSQSIVLLKANPEKPIGNRRSIPLLWFECHPVTWSPWQRGPSKATLYLDPSCVATGHVPKRLQNIAQNYEERINCYNAREIISENSSHFRLLGSLTDALM